jgi:hypothetical protein
VHVTQIIVQSLEITMEYFLPKWSSGAFAIRVASSLFDCFQSNQFYLGSFDLFKIREDLEEVANMRSVPNWIS